MSGNAAPLLPKTALLLIAHGSREKEANADLHHLVAQVRARGHYGVVEACFLESAAPTILEGGTRCIDRGAEVVIMLPYFLSAGIHVLRDLTGARTLLAEKYPHVAIRLAEPMGRHSLLLDIVIQRALEAEARSAEDISS